MSIPNRLILFANHFDRFRRHYSLRTKLAIAEDLGYDGFELQPIEPTDEAGWEEARQTFDASPLDLVGMYVVSAGAADDDADHIAQEIERLEAIIAKLSALAGNTYLNLTIGGNPSPGSAVPHETGSVRAAERHWRRAAKIVAAADHALTERGMRGNLYNHIWFMTDTPQAQLRVIELANAKVIRPGIAAIHAHLHQGVPDVSELLELPGMERLGYFAMLNTWSAPAPFRTMPIDLGEIDFASWLSALWDHGYDGPIIAQAYNLGGDSYLTAKRSIEYIREVWDRFQRNPLLKP